MNKISLVLFAALVAGCTQSPAPTSNATPADRVGETKQESAPTPAAETPKSDRPLDDKNIVSIAVGSKDHTTLVSALKAADYVDSVSNPGPFTVFAPTNAAFDKLPKETLAELMKPESKEKLRGILKYHVAVSTYQVKDFKDGQTLAMADGAKTTIHVKDGKMTINGANVIASIPASNGIIHVIDAVLLPPTS